MPSSKLHQILIVTEMFLCTCFILNIHMYINTKTLIFSIVLLWLQRMPPRIRLVQYGLAVLCVRPYVSTGGICGTMCETICKYMRHMRYYV